MSNPHEKSEPNTRKRNVPHNGRKQRENYPEDNCGKQQAEDSPLRVTPPRWFIIMDATEQAPPRN